MTPNEQFVYNYFASRGFPPAGIAGIMGNLKAESGIMPNNLNDSWNGKYGSDEYFTQQVNTGTFKLSDKNGAYGIAQWLGGRKAGLEQFAAAQGKPIDDLQMQCDYLMYELNTSYTGVRDKLMTATDASKAAKIFQDRFEVCGDGTSARQANTAAFAAEIGAGFVPMVDTTLMQTAQPEANLTVESVSMPKMNIGGKEFDPEFYYNANPEVAAVCGRDANKLAEHYITTGQYEGRMANANDVPVQTQAPQEQTHGMVYHIGEMCKQQGDVDFELADGSIFSAEYNQGTPEFFLNGQSMGTDTNVVEGQLAVMGLSGQVKDSIDNLIARNSAPQQAAASPEVVAQQPAVDPIQLFQAQIQAGVVTPEQVQALMNMIQGQQII